MCFIVSSGVILAACPSIHVLQDRLYAVLRGPKEALSPRSAAGITMTIRKPSSALFLPSTVCLCVWPTLYYVHPYPQHYVHRHSQPPIAAAYRALSLPLFWPRGGRLSTVRHSADTAHECGVIRSRPLVPQVLQGRCGIPKAPVERTPDFRHGN